MRESPERSAARPRRISGGNRTRFALLLLLWGGRSAAQSSEPRPPQSALAEALFQEGKALLELGELTSACAKLSESFRVEPALGALLNLAVCHEREGKIASAWSEFTDALALAERSGELERAEFAKLRAEELRERVPRVKLQISQADVQIQIKLDSQVLGDGAWDSAIPLDPGVHHFEATAPGRKGWETTVNVAKDSGTRILPVPALAVQLPVAPSGPPRHSLPVLPQPRPAAQAGDARRTWGLIAGGVGLIGFGASAFWGLRVLAEQRTLEQDCSGRLCRSDAGLAADRAAHRAATWADISFGTGLAAGALSAYLLITSAYAPGLGSAAPRRSWSLGPAQLSVAATPSSGVLNAAASF